DEAPALSGWAREKFGGFNSKFYAHVFELLLRLRANFLWPAMWGSAIADDDPASPALANEYGIVLGTSHHEPMMRAHDEWRRYGKGPWNYATNAEALRAFWAEGIRRASGFENVVTLAMRGDGDEPMSRDANVALLEKIVADQRALLAADPRWRSAPQVWALYKEVQEYYEKGMRVPDDVTLLWCDDNWGNIRRLPTAEERDRRGGAGVYYHFDYVGGPRSYKWINTYPIPKVGEQMHLAWRYGATRLWIVNVGDIKPMELPISFFLEYAWDPAAWPLERLNDYATVWAARVFGAQHASAIGGMLTAYTRFGGRRKPEMLEPTTYSVANYAESDRIVREYDLLRTRAEALHAALPSEAQAAFFQLVLHPIKASAIVQAMYGAVGRNRLYAMQGRATTGEPARLARDLFRQDEELTREYNERLSNGKWSHLMDQTHLGYTYWQQPPRNAMPGLQELQVPERGELGVAVEGSEQSWPGAWGEPTLPALNPFDGAERSLDVFNRGRAAVSFTVAPSAPWLKADLREGSLGPDRTVRVGARWADVPPGNHDASITIKGSDGSEVVVKVPVVNPAFPRPETAEGFVETNGTVSIEAEHHDRAVAPKGREWKTIPGLGRTLSGVTPWPVTETATLPSGMRLEYRVNLFRDGPVDVAVHLAPTQKFQPGPGFRFAVSFDDETPQVVNVHADESQAAWARSVSDGVTVVTSKHSVKPGPHVLKLWALDPGLVFQKIVVDAGGLKPSYLGPPESPRFVRPARPGS
ncbi:MAG TPA: glycosyl hydrolase 115 family protein, partial [Vicinamibacteria bacterium]|nr:glycosyl hydrolase 115 family protein [Vicinamibacteria bacterium]